MKSLKKTVFLGMAICFSAMTPGVLANTTDLASIIVNESSNIRNTVTKSGEATRTQIVKVFDEVFKAEVDASNKPVGSNIIMKIVNMLAENFYGWYSNGSFPLVPSKLLTLSFKDKILANESSIGSLLIRDSGYNLLRSSDEKSMDLAALLSAKLENGVNNIDREALRLPSSLASSDSAGFFTHNSIFPQGGLHSKAPTIESMPHIGDLLGSDSYINGSNEQNKAQLFMSYLFKALPATSSFQIPKKSGNMITICTPKTATGEASCSDVNAQNGSGGDDYNSEYDRMVDYFNKNGNYKNHKMGMRSSNILRSVYIEPLLRAYQNRTKDSKNENSLVEIERYLAHEGLEEEYYNELKKKSMADVNLETLRAINKLVYLAHKIHRDNEQLKIIAATSAIAISKLTAMQDETNIRVISNQIKERCWDPENRSKDSCKSSGAAIQMPSIER